MTTSTALPLSSAYADTHRGALELVVARLAVSMLRWSEQSGRRRFATLERSVRAGEAARDSAAHDFSRMVRHVRLG